MTFGEQNTEKEAHDILSYSFDQGVNVLDTAEIVSTDYFLTFIKYPFLCFEVKRLIYLLIFNFHFSLLAFSTQFQ